MIRNSIGSVGVTGKALFGIDGSIRSFHALGKDLC